MAIASTETIAAVERVATGAATSEFRGQTRIVVRASDLPAVFTVLKDARGFDLLVDASCVDYLNYHGATDRFGLVYQLAAVTTNERLTVRAYVNDPAPTVTSACGWWAGADWMEREVFDMFGITFAGHPDLRRILCPEAFTAHPLRKDYPLQGRGERHNFPVLTRSQA